MATTTPRPTNEQLYALLLTVDQRVSLAQEELVRRLNTELPGFIDYMNNRLNLTQDRRITTPREVVPAPHIIDDGYINKICVAVAGSTEGFSPGIFINPLQVTVYSIDERIENATQIRIGWDRMGCIRAVLRAYLNGCVDAGGREAWTTLVPSGFSTLPEQWAEFSGTTCYYSLTQSPPDLSAPAPDHAWK